MERKTRLARQGRQRRARHAGRGQGQGRDREAPSIGRVLDRQIVGTEANLDDLIADLQAELRARPYELVFVAGGYQLRTRPRFGAVIRLAGGADLQDAGPPALTQTEMLALAGIAYLQPATRAARSRLAGREISRDVLGALKHHGLIAAALRAPEPGAPLAWVTTGRFLEAFGLASLRELPDLERIEDEGLLQKPREDTDLDAALGLGDDRDQLREEDFSSDNVDLR